MKLIRNALAASFLAAVSVSACSSQHGSTTAGDPSGGGQVGINSAGHGNTGSVGMHLTIGNNLHINTLNWTITSTTSTATYTGVINITDDAGNEAQSIEFVAGGIQAGSYTVTLSGFDSAGDPCNGTSATVTVIAGATSGAGVLITCTVPTDASLATQVDSGNIAVDAGVILVNQAPFVCPGITGVSVSPAELINQQVAALAGTFTGSSGGTQTLAWTSSCPGAVITNPTSANASFACGSTAPGTLCTVTLTVGVNGTAADGGSVGQVCTGVANTVTNEQIVCELGGTAMCFAPTPDNCSTDGGLSCTNKQTDVNNCGTCGTVCGAATPNCIAGICKATPPPPPVPCSGINTPAGCVPCKGSPNGVCSTTQALVLNYDIAKNGLTAATPTTKAASCYYCMVAGGCLDSVAKNSVPGVTTQNKSGLECGDPASATNVSSTNVAHCTDALSCVISSNHCTTTSAGNPSADPNASVSDCFCGTNLGPACVNPGPNGACKTNEFTDLGTTDPTQAQTIFTDGSQSPGGVGNQVLNCALTSNCNVCFN